MPESVSTVDAILDGLRDRATGWSCVPLADAEAAVQAAAERLDAVTAERDRWKAETKNMRQLERQINAVKIREAADTRTREIIAWLRDAARASAEIGAEHGAAFHNLAAAFIARRFPVSDCDTTRNEEQA